MGVSAGAGVQQVAPVAMPTGAKRKPVPIETLRMIAALEAEIKARGLTVPQVRVVGRYDKFRAWYRDRPVEFVHDCLAWGEDERPTAYQDELMAALVAHRRVALRGPHGLGKSACVAWIILWHALTRDGEDWKIPTTASAWRQLERYLWPEVHKWARRVKWGRVGRPAFDDHKELMNLTLKLRTGQAFAASSDTPEWMEGAHADQLLYVFDEAKAIPVGIWDAAEGALSSGEAYALAVSTPGEPVGRFYEIHSRRAGLEDWWVRHVTLEEAVAAGRVSVDWAEQRKRQWGERSAVYQNRVLGEFAAAEADGVIGLALIEAANERWREMSERGVWPQGPLVVGADISRSGEDKTVLALRRGGAVVELRRSSKEDLMETTGRVVGALRGEGSGSTSRAVVDVDGIGAGVVDRLREQGLDVVAFNAGAGTDVRDRSGEVGYANVRAAAWWGLRERMEAGEVALPPDDLLMGDLVTPRSRMTSGGKRLLESKDEIRRRLGRSTDDGDAVAMAFWEGGGGADIVWEGSWEPVVESEAMRKVKGEFEGEGGARGVSMSWG